MRITVPGRRCDIHVLASRGNREWLEQTLASVAGTGQVHVIEGGFEGSIGQARAYAFGLGTAPYVSYVDDDDYALPSAMATCIAYLDAHPSCIGVYTDRQELRPDGSLTDRRLGPWHPHHQLCDAALVTHLKVMRRELVERYRAELALWPTYEEYVLCGLLAAHGPWRHLPIMGAVRRVGWPSYSGRLDRPGLWRRAATRVAACLLAPRIAH